jgi:hypothetical protein
MSTRGGQPHCQRTQLKMADGAHSMICGPVLSRAAQKIHTVGSRSAGAYVCPQGRQGLGELAAQAQYARADVRRVVALAGLA